MNFQQWLEHYDVDGVRIDWYGSMFKWRCVILIGKRYAVGFGPEPGIALEQARAKVETGYMVEDT